MVFAYQSLCVDVELIMDGCRFLYDNYPEIELAEIVWNGLNEA